MTVKIENFVEEKKKKLLLIDGLNHFLRHYCVNPTLSRNGEPVGGIVGSVNSLINFIDKFNPDKIIIVWDGHKGSLRRKQFYKEYKSNRKPKKFNWDTSYFEPNESFQRTNLFNLFSFLPFYQFIFDTIEADDIISYICQIDCYSNWLKIIVSSDRDFIQLLNKDTILFRPIQDEIFDVEKTVRKYKIHPNNFLLARSIIGDESDNIEGISGAGFSTIAKRFPFLIEEKQYLIADVIKYCEEAKKKYKLKLYDNILNNQLNIERNYSLIQLCKPQIGITDVLSINEIIKNKKLSFQKVKFVMLVNELNISMFNLSSVNQYFNRIMWNQ